MTACLAHAKAIIDASVDAANSLLAQSFACELTLVPALASQHSIYGQGVMKLSNLQEFIYKLEDTINGNEGCMDTINVSGALQKLAAACCLVTPVGEALFTAQRLFQKLIGLALNLQGSFKIDAINITIGALARLSVNASNNLMPPAGSDEALNVQVRDCNSVL